MNLHSQVACPRTCFVALGLVIFCSGLSFADDLRRGGTFGVRVIPVPQEMREKLKLLEGTGILVAEVFSGGSAEAAGILADDIILKFDETTI